MPKLEVVDLKEESDVVKARQAGRNMARELGFGIADQTRFATSISELARNVLVHGGAKGTCKVIEASDQHNTRLRVIVEDNGPGISDVEQALVDGFSTVGSLGAGLPGSKRLSHEFKIETEPGLTRVTIAIVQPKGASGSQRASPLRGGGGRFQQRRRFR